ncbi:MAG: L,D-transpeptidase family protein [Pseudobdellovibrionaceae bacterium]|nr:L,D-transpeptidase family protein [Bdellovibrionales bacterium]USN48842.1 MAG: L,D-transpeptidase family protein [Pseudobdellovibrionaceae bacterium]
MGLLFGQLLIYALLAAQGMGLSQALAEDPPSQAAEAPLSIESDPEAVIPPKGLVPTSLLRLGNKQYASRFALLADKSQRTLSVWEQQEDKLHFVSAYPMDFGRSEGDKLVSGDKKTPEGIYFFEEMLEGESLNFDEYGKRAFTMNYPNFFDLLQGKSGSGIWLHAIPESKSLNRGSRGCLVVRNAVIDTVGKYIDLSNTPIVVQHNVTYVFPEERIQKQQTLQSWLDRWRLSWQSQDLDSYMTFYSEKFRGNNMSKAQWRRYKKSLNEKYSSIEVKVEHPIILANDSEVFFRFLQKYKSDRLNDTGEKQLFVTGPNQQSLEILGEIWSPVKIKNDEVVAHQQSATSSTAENL